MINVTDKALAEISRLLKKETNNHVLCVQVVGGGCSGMSYKLSFIEEVNLYSDIQKFFHCLDEVTIVTDPKSSFFINGMTLDFSDGLNGKGFIFNNPQAKRSCGCGESFST